MQIGMGVRWWLLGAAIAACSTADGPAVMNDSTFVTTMARLHIVERNYQLNDAARDSLRRRVLQEQGLTPEELEGQARHYAAQPARASAIWSAIARKALVLGGDTTAAGRQQEQTR